MRVLDFGQISEFRDFGKIEIWLKTYFSLNINGLHSLFRIQLRSSEIWSPKFATS